MDGNYVIIKKAIQKGFDIMKNGEGIWKKRSTSRKGLGVEIN